MIVKILSSASKDFHGVKYNDKKINSDKGELMDMKNFPSFINKDSSQEEVRNYLKSISQSNKTKKPQFHAVISTKFQEHSREQLTKIANEFMKEMGYGLQPYIVVFHKDTENNHVHIVSTRVDKDTGKKINDSFEKIKSQQALSKAMETVLGVSREADIDKLLQYKYSTFQQLEKLLEQNGFKVHINESNPNQANILHNGLCHKTLFLDKLHYEKVDKNDKRAKQIKAFLEKYKEMYSNKVFKVIDNREEKGLYDKNKYNHTPVSPKIEYRSELQEKLKNIFGIDIIFHYKDDKQPFGYTLIDNATQRIYKGSEIAKMNDIFEFTQDIIEKEDFERLREYNIRSDKEKQIILQFYTSQGKDIKDFMLFENKKFKASEKDENFKQLKADVKASTQNQLKNDFVVFQKDTNGDYYAIHQRYHQVHKLESLLGKEASIGELRMNTSETGISTHTDFNHSNSNVSEVFHSKKENSFIEEVGNALSKSAIVGRDTTEDEFKKRRKKRR